MQEHVSVLRCPTSRSTLLFAGDRLVADDGRSYVVRDGVAELLPVTRGNEEVQAYYDDFGWRCDEGGNFEETKTFVDRRRAPMAFTNRCIKRIGRYFRRGGRYLLDAGCGPIVHDGLVEYHRSFQYRVCLDISGRALQHAKRKIGERGVYVQGDLTSLPLQDGCMDAVICNHVIYQLQDDEMQVRAFLELWRVLKPGGVAVVNYSWDKAPLPWRLARLARALGLDGPGYMDSPDYEQPALIYSPRSRRWFEAQSWPFRYRYDVYRLVENSFMRAHVPGDWRGSTLLLLLRLLQSALPEFCGRHGAMPAIIIRKPVESV